MDEEALLPLSPPPPHVVPSIASLNISNTTRNLPPFHHTSAPTSPHSPLTSPSHSSKSKNFSSQFSTSASPSSSPSPSSPSSFKDGGDGEAKKQYHKMRSSFVALLLSPRPREEDDHKKKSKTWGGPKSKSLDQEKVECLSTDGPEKRKKAKENFLLKTLRKSKTKEERKREKELERQREKEIELKVREDMQHSDFGWEFAESTSVSEELWTQEEYTSG